MVGRGAGAPPMKTIKVARWKLVSATIPGKIVTTRHEMTEAEAKARDPNAERVTAWEERKVYEDGDEVPTNTKPFDPAKGH